MIKSNEISIVVQGAIEKKTISLCLKSIRKFLPNAEIILSTWKDCNIDNLDYDILVLNDDPGCYRHDWAIQNLPNSMNNFNRQLVSTSNGIKKADRKYILKLRSDLILKNANFLKYFDKFESRKEEFKMFEHRVLCASLFSREYACKYGTGFPVLFHPSDFWFFGLNEDIKDYFIDCPLQTEKEASNWEYKYPNRIPYISAAWRYTPEQFFCINWVKKYFKDVQFEDWSDWNKENIELSNNILYNNFIMLGFEQSGIYCKKHFKSEKTKEKILGLITYEHFEKQYKNYCNSNYCLASSSEKKYLYKLERHYEEFIFPIKKTFNWIGEIFSIFYYAILYIISIFIGFKKK